MQPILHLLTVRFEISLLVGAIVGVGASLIGVFVVLRRLALAGDALSHVALPGIGIAVALRINPFFGALAFLIAGVIGIVLIERRTNLSVDAIVGVLFTASLAIGALVSPSAESLLESLFGDISKLTRFDAVIGLVFGLSAIGITLLRFKDFTRLTLSAELAQSEGVAVEKTEFLLLMLLAVMVAVGIKIVGILLLGALIIIPAASAKNLGGSMRAVTLLAVIFGLVTVIVGLILADIFHVAPGPMVVLSNTGVFVVSLFWPKGSTA